MSDETARIDGTIRITCAIIEKNPVPASEVPDLLRLIYNAVLNMGTSPTVKEPAPLVPAVPIGKSVTPDAIICLEDGKPYKSMKRHLMAHYGMTPEQYRAKWGLPQDYPMVAENYARKRSEIAKAMRLGNPESTRR